MIGSVLMALAFVGPQDTAEVGRAWVTARPERVAIGEPIVLALEVHHARRDRARLDDDDPLPDDTWVLVDGPRRTVELLADGDAATRIRWTIFSLEPGERTLPDIEVRLESGETLTASGGVVHVEGELGPDEDEPRPLTDFHEVEERTSDVRPRHLAIGAGLFVLACGCVLFARRRLARTPDELDVSTSLDTLSVSDDDDGETRRALLFELSALMRGAIDGRLGVELEGHTDMEWIEALRADGRLEPDLVDELSLVLDACAEAKYAGAEPTRFRVDELLDGARRAVDRAEVRSPVPVLEELPEPDDRRDDGGGA